MQLLPDILDGFCIGHRERGVGGGLIGWNEGKRKVAEELPAEKTLGSEFPCEASAGKITVSECSDAVSVLTNKQSGYPDSLLGVTDKQSEHPDPLLGVADKQSGCPDPLLEVADKQSEHPDALSVVTDKQSERPNEAVAGKNTASECPDAVLARLTRNLGVQTRCLQGWQRIWVSRRGVCKAGNESECPDCLSESLIPGPEAPNPIFSSNFHHSL